MVIVIIKKLKYKQYFFGGTVTKRFLTIAKVLWMLLIILSSLVFVSAGFMLIKKSENPVNPPEEINQSSYKEVENGEKIQPFMVKAIHSCGDVNIPEYIEIDPTGKNNLSNKEIIVFNEKNLEEEVTIDPSPICKYCGKEKF